MKTCPRCAASLQDSVAFCPSCGSSVGAYAAAPPLSPPSNPLNHGASTAYAVAPATSGKAIASLVCGILAYIIPFFLAIPAIVFGHIALSDIKKSAGRLKGQGLAIAGLVLGYLGIAVIPFILIIAAIAIPNLLRSRMAANEATAVGTLRTYNTAMVTYASMCPNNGFPGSVQNLGPGGSGCERANLVGAVLAAPDASKSGYRFFYSPGQSDNLGRVVSYTIAADPITDNTTGIRHFFTDESGVIRASNGVPATVESPQLQ